MNSAASSGARRERRALVDELWEHEVLETLSRYVSIECLSPAFDPRWRGRGALAEAAELLRSWCAARPVEATIELVELAGRTPVLFAEVAPTNASRASQTTLIYGHLDKQPALGPWRAGLDVFVATRDGDRLYGRGTGDDGYAVFAAFTALEVAVRQQIGHGRVVVLIEASEESGSPDLDAHLEQLAAAIGVPDLVICLDSGCPTYDRLWTTTSLRGVVVATIEVEVLREGVHSGLAGGIVPSSFRIARELLSRVEDPHSGAITLAACTAEPSVARRIAIDQVAAEFGERALGEFPTVGGLELTGRDTAERLRHGTWDPALEVIGVGGAPPPADAGNVLRPSTTLRLAMRIPPSVDAIAAGEALRATLEADPPSRATVRVTIDQVADGWEAPEVDPWLTRALEEASLAYYGASARSIGLGGSIPFMADLGRRFPGVQFVATGVLGPESNAHGPNEFLHLPSAKAITATIVDLLDARR